MENKRKHLEFIQTIIGRMAGNLFFLRGWTITMIGALLALFSKNNSPGYVFYFLDFRRIFSIPRAFIQRFV